MSGVAWSSGHLIGIEGAKCLGAGITRIGIKSFVETVRLQTLNRQGLQQLQVDVHFLRPQLRRSATEFTSDLPL